MAEGMCLTSFVFGHKYQDYIPLFIYSAKSAYPQYAIYIFVNGKLKDSVRSQLALLEHFTDVDIEEDYISDVSFTNSVAHGAAVRWLLWNPVFTEYKGVYVADIDIFYCREKVPILEQHLLHCEAIGKPFSNIQREEKQLKRFDMKRFLSNLRSMPLGICVKHLLLARGLEKRLTGLHFYQPKMFKNKILPKLDCYKKKLRDKVFLPHHPNGFNDESFLYDIIDNAGLSDGLPISNVNSVMLTSAPSSQVFRPHHGLHLGIFRSNRYSNDSKEILNTSVYYSYYKTFCQLEKTELFKCLSEYFTRGMKVEIENLHSYYD